MVGLPETERALRENSGRKRGQGAAIALTERIVEAGVRWERAGPGLHEVGRSRYKWMKKEFENRLEAHACQGKEGPLNSSDEGTQHMESSALGRSLWQTAGRVGTIQGD